MEERLVDIFKEYTKGDFMYSFALYTPTKDDIDIIIDGQKKVKEEDFDDSLVAIIKHNYTGKHTHDTLIIKANVIISTLKVVLKELENKALFEYCIVVRDVLNEYEEICEVMVNS